MKKILIKLALIIMVLVIADRLFAIYFSKNIFSKTISGESGGTANYLLQKKKDVSFIILGSSRAKFHINPALLSNIYQANGYNAGISGTGGLIYNDLLLKLIVSQGIKPQLIILQVDVFPYFTLDDDNIINEISQLYPFLGESQPLKLAIDKHTDYAEKFKLLLHTYRYNGKLLSILFNYSRRNKVFNNNGFEGLKSNFDSTAIFETPEQGKKYRYATTKLEALTGIINTCKANNIKLKVVFSPSYKNSLWLPEGNKMIIDRMRKNGVTEIYDYSDVDKLPALKPAVFWKDAAHLNDSGAVIFSRILNDSLATH